MAVDVSSPQNQDQSFASPYSRKQSRVFLDTLHQRRASVFEHMKKHSQSDQISSFIFDLFTRFAQSGKKQLDTTSIQKLNEQFGRFDSPTSEVKLTLPNGTMLTLEYALTLGAPPAGTHELVNAFFAQGYQNYLNDKPNADRQNFTSKIVKLLPGIERLGPFLLSDFIDHACSEEDSLRFWQLYTERVASELHRRTSETDPDFETTWTLSALLGLYEAGPSALAGRRWDLLRRHIDRIMQCKHHQWRARFLRVVAESCQDHRVLYFIFTSPAVIEDSEIPFIFLTRFNPKLISCALFIIHYRKANRRLINRLLEHFSDKSLAAVGDRLVEIYSQLYLFEHPSKSIEIIREGLVHLVEHKTKKEPIDVLLNAVKNDARAFRQNLLLAHVVPTDRGKTSVPQTQLLERVLQGFFLAFTPSGVRHPLNDDVYRNGVVHAIVELMRIRDNQQGAHLRSVGLNLHNDAQRWLPDDEDQAKRKLLLSYFIGIFTYVLIRAGRSLYMNVETRPQAMELYRILVELYLTHPIESFESGGYGTLNPILQTLYPDLISSEYMEAPSRSRVEEVADLLAQLEYEQFSADRLTGLLEEWKEKNYGRDLAQAQEEDEIEPVEVADPLPELEISTKGHIPIITHQAIEAPVVLLSRRENKNQSVLRAYLGLDFLQYLSQKILHYLGFQTMGRLTLLDDQIIFKEQTQRNGHDFARSEVRFHTSQVNGIQLTQPFRYFYSVLGVCVLATLSLSGGHFLFAGVQGFEMGLGLVGLGMILVGFFFDSMMSSLSERGRNKVILDIFRHNQSRPLSLEVDRTLVSGEALLDAFLTKETHRRQDDYNQGWMDLAMEGSQQKSQDQSEEDEENQDQQNQESSSEAESSEEKATFSDPSDAESGEGLNEIANLDLDQLGGNTGPLPPIPEETQVSTPALTDFEIEPVNQTDLATDLNENIDLIGAQSGLSDIDLDALSTQKSEN